MNMIERVARAINGDMWAGFDDYCRKMEYTPSQIEEAKGGIAIKVSLNRARAAIEAMRQPSDAMTDAGGTEGDKHTSDGLFGHSHPGYQDGAAADIYRAMITAALNEGKEGE